MYDSTEGRGIRTTALGIALAIDRLTRLMLGATNMSDELTLRYVAKIRWLRSLRRVPRQP